MGYFPLGIRFGNQACNSRNTLIHLDPQWASSLCFTASDFAEEAFSAKLGECQFQAETRGSNLTCLRERFSAWGRFGFKSLGSVDWGLTVLKVAKPTSKTKKNTA